MNSINSRTLPKTELVLDEQLTILEKNIALLDTAISELKVAVDIAHEKLIWLKEEKNYPLKRL